MTGGVVSQMPGNLTYNDSADATYQWQWDGLGAGPSATIVQNLDVTTTPIAYGATAGVYASASREVRYGLYNPSDDSGYAGNPTPNSDYGSTTLFPAGATGGASSTQSPNLTASLQPQNFYGYYRIQVKIKASTWSGATLTPDNAGAQASGSAKGGLQKVTPTTQTLTYAP